MMHAERPARWGGKVAALLRAPPVALAVGGILLIGACDRTPLDSAAGPGQPTGGDGVVPAAVLLLECSMDVRAAEMTCGSVEPRLPEGLNANRIVGGQDLYVKLTSSGTAYDAGAEIFRTDVRLQNLTGWPMGTADGITVDGIRVFFHEGPTVTAGSGTVTLENADGADTFTAADQPYFAWSTILAPLELSGTKEWRFNVPGTVSTFSFQVYVAAELNEGDDSTPLLHSIWGGAVSGSWTDLANWQGSELPDSSRSVSVPPADQVPGEYQPVLAADAAVRHLRVGTGSTLDLGGHQITVAEAVEAVGPITGGQVVLGSASAGIVAGDLPDLHIAGSARVQGDMHVDGVLVISGSLMVRDGAVVVRGAAAD